MFLSAQDPNKTVTENSIPTIVVGVDNYEPFSFKDEEGNIIGIDVELAKEVFHRLNYSPEFKFIDWSKKKEL